MMTARNGRVLDVDVQQYHALPALSASIAKVLIASSPAHASQALQDERTPTDAMDRGAVGHRLLLGKGDDYVVLPFADWRTKAAKEAREAARAQRKVALLQHAFDEISVAVRGIALRLQQLGIRFDGESEFAIGWEEHIGGQAQACRCRMDHARIGAAGAQIFELKLVESAHPEAVERSSESLGYAIATAAYIRALEALRPDLRGRVEFLFIFAELAPPFAVNVCRPDSTFTAIGASRWERAVRQWSQCEQRRYWPSYGDGINTISVPPWAITREMAAEERDHEQ